jgi:voltage-gated potassium channel Kch
MPAAKLNSIRMIRMLRLFRLFKLSKLVSLDDRLGTFGITPSLTAILTLMMQIFFIAHLYACFWHFITLSDANEVTPPRTWVTEFGYENTPEYPRYIASFYYIIVTMLTVGYGDIHATNEIERMYAIVTMLTGGIVFGALISKVARLIDTRNPQAKAFKANMDELKAFMEEIQLPKALRLKAKVRLLNDYFYAE